jgi:hypothetical protein
MCIACAIPKGEKLTEQEFENSWLNNPDGGGYAFINEHGRIIVRKSMDYNKFRDMFNKDIEKYGQHSPFSLHFRIKSAGPVQISNNHPFSVNPRLIMMHNGTLPIQTEGDWSDTRTFAKRVLGVLPINFHKNSGILHMLEVYALKSNSKIVLMDSHGDFTILNTKAGTVKNNIWFSNTSCNYRPAVQTYLPAKTNEKWSNKSNTNYQGSSKKSGNVSTLTHKCRLCERTIYRDFEWAYSVSICKDCDLFLTKIQNRGSTRLNGEDIIKDMVVTHGSVWSTPLSRLSSIYENDADAYAAFFGKNHHGQFVEGWAG